MKHVPSIIALVLIVAACNLSNRFKTSNNSNSSTSPSSSSDKSVTGGEPVEKPNPTAAQTAAIANGQEVKWDQQGITWTVPANWKKQDVRNETLSYAGGGAFLSANISTMDSSFPTDVSIKAMNEGARTRRRVASTMKSNGSPSTISAALSFASQNKRDLTTFAAWNGRDIALTRDKLS